MIINIIIGFHEFFIIFSGQSNDKEEWDDDEGFHEGRDKSRGSKGPPRMRRGGGGSNTRGGSSLGGSSRDFTGENGNSEQVGQGGVSMGGRGGASRRGDQPPRRGGRGGGARSFSSRQQSGQNHHSDRGHGLSSSNTGGFQGSIDTWNNPGNWGDDFSQADDWDNEVLKFANSLMLP